MGAAPLRPVSCVNSRPDGGKQKPLGSSLPRRNRVCRLRRRLEARGFWAHCKRLRRLTSTIFAVLLLFTNSYWGSNHAEALKANNTPASCFASANASRSVQPVVLCGRHGYLTPSTRRISAVGHCSFASPGMRIGRIGPVSLQA